MKIVLIGSAIFLITLFATQTSEATLPEKEYFRALKILDQSITKGRSLLNQHNSTLSNQLSQELLGRAYQQNEQWKVKAWLKQPHPISSSPEGKTGVGRGTFFQYQVTQFDQGQHPKMQLRVQPMDENFSNDRISALTFEFEDGLKPTRKSFLWNHNLNSRTTAPAQALNLHYSSLELFPLQLPDLTTAERKSISKLPDLPEKIRKEAQSLGFAPDLNRAIAFELSDFFGRRTFILWQLGDPWPSLIQNSNGISILVKEKK